MAENIEWGACPVCGGRVTGKIDSWRSGDRLHVDQPCDEPPVCGDGCPLEDFAPASPSSSNAVTGSLPRRS